MILSLKVSFCMRNWNIMAIQAEFSNSDFLALGRHHLPILDMKKWWLRPSSPFIIGTVPSSSCAAFSSRFHIFLYPIFRCFSSTLIFLHLLQIPLLAYISWKAGSVVTDCCSSKISFTSEASYSIGFSHCRPFINASGDAVRPFGHEFLH